jgi:hypothetical protein
VRPAASMISKAAYQLGKRNDPDGYRIEIIGRSDN